MKKILILSLVTILALTGCTAKQETEISSGELASFNGKDGNKCYVAISGKVYEISNSDLWKNGVHTESRGLAECGKDLTDVIAEAPHGVSILTTSPKVKQIGNLVN